MAQASSLAQIYGSRGRTMAPGAASLPFLSRAFERGPSGPFDISHPLMGYALGRGMSKYQADQETAAALEEAKKTELPAKWQAAITADPTLTSDPIKMTNWFMTNAPDLLKNLATIFQAQHAGAQATQTTALTAPQVAKTTAEAYRTGVTLPGLDIARAGEAQARTGLLGAQTTTEGYRPSLLEAQTGTQKSLAELYGQRATTEQQKRPLTLEEIQAGTERLKALGIKLRKETELMPKEGKYQPGGKAPSFKEQKLMDMWDQLSPDAQLKVVGALPSDKELTEGNILGAYSNLMTDPGVREQLKPLIDEILKRTITKQGPQGGKAVNLLPEGSKQIGTYQGKPVYQTPDGRRLTVE